MRTFPSCLLWFLLSNYFQSYCNLEYFVSISSLIHSWYIIVSQNHASSLWRSRSTIDLRLKINAEFRGRERTTVCILKYEWNMPHNYRKRNRNWSEGTSIFKYFCWPVVMRAKQVARKLSVSSEELKSVITNYIWNIYC